MAIKRVCANCGETMYLHPWDWRMLEEDEEPVAPDVCVCDTCLEELERDDDLRRD